MQNTPYGNEELGLGGDAGRDLPLVNGTPVYDATGNKIGKISQHRTGERYFVLTKGFLFPRDLYVPLSVIQRATTDGIYLGLSKAQINNQNWDQPPTENSIPATRMAAPQDTANRAATTRQGQMKDEPDVDDRDAEEHVVDTEEPHWNQSEPPPPAPQP